MAARRPEVHHAAPRCLLTLHERANGAELDGEGIQAWVEWEIEAMRWRVPVEIARSRSGGPDRLVGGRPGEGEAPPRPRLRLAQVGSKGREGDSEEIRRRLVCSPGLEEVGTPVSRGSRGGEGVEMRLLEFSVGRGAGISSKAPKIVFNERKGT